MYGLVLNLEDKVRNKFGGTLGIVVGLWMDSLRKTAGFQNKGIWGACERGLD
ncbi:hypothetical protein Scep_026240 [Stephania cephalantha]|uniref:Uncharacterized protein n=1 Tax=Stephania cephalantha TaxID=152367 RepID=A0AAP0HSB2_9MAGN